jgi:hypothetical protein
MPLSDFLNVSINLQGASPSQPGFGVPIILGKCAAWGASTDRIRYYSGIAGLTSDGFVTTDPEYLAASALFSQNPAPSSIALGKRATANLPTMKVVFTVVQAVVGKVYSVVVNGVVKSFTAVDTVPANVAIGLATAIGTPTGFGAAVAATNTVTCTASVAGNWGRFAINTALTTPNTDLDCQQTHVDAGIVTDAAAIATIDSTWYAILSVWNSNAEVAALAGWAETNNKLYLADTQDSTVLGSGTGDIASTLKASLYVNTAVLYNPDNGVFAAAAWAGARLPTQPGSETWKFVTLAGVPVVTLTATQITNLTTKRCNYYYSVAGIGMTAEGITPSGQFLDVVRGRAWMVATIQTDVFTVLTSPPSGANPANPAGSSLLTKVPFTDTGIAVVENALRGSLAKGVAAGLLASSPAPYVSVPKAASVSTANKTNRKLSPITWGATIAGAVHSVDITGSLTF